ncbi:RTA1 like protein-domain-containing protein [Xylariomycetidae sp. FL0641]|nr:RTA1 like protein-domain-containing protein [Xylariomycetidae sp. FL0641]
MPSPSDFTPVCNVTVTSSDDCTPETCCLAQGHMDYLPNLAANVIFIALFGILLLPNAIFGIRYKTWSFMVWITLGLLGEAVGYAGRVMLYYDIFDFNAFVIYLVPLTIAPAFLTASIYLCLARLVHVLDPALRATRLRPMTYTKLFVTCDVVSLVLQAVGGAVASVADTPDQSDLGVDIMIAGLAFQVFSLVVFVLLCADFAFRLARRRHAESRWCSALAGKSTSTASGLADLDTSYDSADTTPPATSSSSSSGDPSFDAIAAGAMFKGFVAALAAAVALILVRSVYRLIELQQGFSGPLANNQTVFMVLEPPEIFLAVLLLVVFHPGFALRGLWAMDDLRARSSSAIVAAGEGEGEGEAREMTAVAAAAAAAPPPPEARASWFAFGRENRRGTYSSVTA